MEGQQALTFGIMVLVTPLFLVVLVAALILVGPFILPFWLGERWQRRRLTRVTR